MKKSSLENIFVPGPEQAHAELLVLKKEPTKVDLNRLYADANGIEIEAVRHICIFTEDHLRLSNAYQSCDKYCDKVDMIRFRTHVVLHQPNWSLEQIKTHISHLAFRERPIISAFVANDRIRMPASRAKLASRNPKKDAICFEKHATSFE